MQPPSLRAGDEEPENHRRHHETRRAGSVEGRGKHDGKDVVFFVVAFQHAKDRVGIVAFIGDPAIRRLYPSTIKERKD